MAETHWHSTAELGNRTVRATYVSVADRALISLHVRLGDTSSDLCTALLVDRFANFARFGTTALETPNGLCEWQFALNKQLICTLI